MTATSPTPRFLVTGGRGDPAAVDAYLYGDNERMLTRTHGDGFVTLILVTTTGGFGAEPQADRLASGLYGTTVHETFESAFERLAELEDLVRGVPR